MSDRIYKDFVEDIIENCQDIINFTSKMSFNDFKSDKKTKNAVIRCLEVIGEAASKIPQETRKKYNDIPWREMITMRNKLIHEYFGVDSSILWETIKKDIPFLLQTIKENL